MPTIRPVGHPAPLRSARDPRLLKASRQARGPRFPASSAADSAIPAPQCIEQPSRDPRLGCRKPCELALGQLQPTVHLDHFLLQRSHQHQGPGLLGFCPSQPLFQAIGETLGPALNQQCAFQFPPGLTQAVAEGRTPTSEGCDVLHVGTLFPSRAHDSGPSPRRPRDQVAILLRSGFNAHPPLIGPKTPSLPLGGQFPGVPGPLGLCCGLPVTYSG